MRLAARMPLARILAIDRAVRAGGWPNASTLARELEVRTRTIRRDIAYMRDQLGAPLQYVPRRRGYRYAEPAFRLPYVQLTEGELIALVVAQDVLRQYRGTPFGPDLERAFAKIAAAPGEPAPADLGRLNEVLSFRLTAPAARELGIMRDLIEAAARRRRIVIDYRSASRGRRTRRAVDPYHVACVDSQYYLVGRCHLRGDVRLFAPARIERLELTGESFEPPADFSIESFLSASLAVFRGGPGELHRVRLRFDRAAAPFIRERRWHPGQSIEPMPDGGLVLSLELGHLREAERLALSWAPHCEVLEPPELRRSVAEALRRGLKLNA